jgi:hypothetical protein
MDEEKYSRLPKPQPEKAEDPPDEPPGPDATTESAPPDEPPGPDAPPAE